jgi:hypothetical protein
MFVFLTGVNKVDTKEPVLESEGNREGIAVHLEIARGNASDKKAIEYRKANE